MFPSNNNTLCLKGLACLLCLPANLLLSVPQMSRVFQTSPVSPYPDSHQKMHAWIWNPLCRIQQELYSCRISCFQNRRLCTSTHLFHVLEFCTPRMVTGIVYHHISFKLSRQKALILLFRGRSTPNENRGNFLAMHHLSQIYALKISMRKYKNLCCFQNKWHCFVVFPLVVRWAIVPRGTFK